MVRREGSVKGDEAPALAAGTTELEVFEPAVPISARTRAIRGLYVLLVDDGPQAAALSVQLREAGLKVMVATTSAEALARVVMRRPDIVLVDVTFQIASPSGVGLIGLLRDLEPELPAIVMSGYTREHVALAISTQSVGVGYVEKPIELDQLVAVVSELTAAT
jgi:two-component system, NtrC family, nitrogen regulation response regulator NtrX